MNLRRHFLEAATLVIAAILCALVANLLASRERKVALVGSYPNALTVPKRTDPPPPAPADPVGQPVAEAASVPAATPAATSPAQTTAIPAGQPAAAPKQPGQPAAAPPAARTAAPAKASDAEIMARFPVHEGTPYREISGADAEWLHQQGVPFLDARRTSVYEGGHIPGARSFPVWEADIDERVSALMNEGLDPKRPLVLYCSGGDCEDSHMLAQKLWGVFFNNALVYKDGFPDWQKRGNPVHTGAQP